MLSVHIRIASMRRFLVSTHNIQIYNELNKNPYILIFLSYRKNFVGTQKPVQISHGKRAIEVRYCMKCQLLRFDCIEGKIR